MTVDREQTRRDAPYKVVFTPVGWHVVDTRDARDPVGQFGLGPGEYDRAVRLVTERNFDWRQQQ